MKYLTHKLKGKHFALQTLCCLALTIATFAANTRCAYIYHNPPKPDSLSLLKKS